MDDLVKSFKAQLYDRVSSPLLSSFFLSWAAWNHRLFFALASDLKLEKKFAFIDEVLYPTWYEVLGRGFTLPLLSALALLYIYPWPARKVYEHVRNEQRRLKAIQYRIDEESPISEEEARDLRRELRSAAENADKQLSQRDSLIKDLKVELAEARKEISALKPQSSSSQPDIALSEVEAEVLRHLALHRQLSRDELEVYLDGQENIVVLHALDQLMEKKLLEAPDGFEFGKTRYQLSPAGRKYYLRDVTQP